MIKKSLHLTVSSFATALAYIVIAPLFLTYSDQASFALLGLIAVLSGWVSFVDVGFSGYIQKNLRPTKLNLTADDIVSFDRVNIFLGIFVALAALYYVNFMIKLFEISVFETFLLISIIPLKALQGTSRAILMINMKYEFLAWLSCSLALCRLLIPLLIIVYIAGDDYSLIIISVATILTFVETLGLKVKCLKPIKALPLTLMEKLSVLSHLKLCFPLGLMSAMWAFTSQIERNIVFTSTNLEFLVFYNLMLQISTGLHLVFGSVLAVTVSFLLSKNEDQKIFWSSFNNILLAWIALSFAFLFAMYVFYYVGIPKFDHFSVIYSFTVEFWLIISGVILQFVNSICYVLILAFNMNFYGVVVSLLQFLVMLFCGILFYENKEFIIIVWPVLNSLLFFFGLPTAILIARRKAHEF